MKAQEQLSCVKSIKLKAHIIWKNCFCIRNLNVYLQYRTCFLFKSLKIKIIPWWKFQQPLNMISYKMNYSYVALDFLYYSNTKVEDIFVPPFFANVFNACLGIRSDYFNNSCKKKKHHDGLLSETAQLQLHRTIWPQENHKYRIWNSFPELLYLLFFPIWIMNIQKNLVLFIYVVPYYSCSRFLTFDRCAKKNVKLSVESEYSAVQSKCLKLGSVER